MESHLQCLSCSWFPASIGWNVRVFAFIHSFTHSFIHSFILEPYTAPLQDTTTQRRSQPSHGQRRTVYSQSSHGQRGRTVCSYGGNFWIGALERVETVWRESLHLCSICAIRVVDRLSQNQNPSRSDKGFMFYEGL